MPLDSRKKAKILSNLDSIFASRTQPITFTLMNPDGSTSTLTISCVFRPQYDFDPTFDSAPGGSNEFHASDALLMVKQSDLSYAQLRQVIAVSPQTPVGADAFASRYIPTSIRSQGLMPGGDKWVITLERQRP